MAGRIPRVVVRLAAGVRDAVGGLTGVMAPLRSADGTFGTQRANAQQQAERRESYPRD